ncbi:SDR family NAD(P)-dependent oxidoreductase [Nocardia donostiensis]|uniref:3-oxoacyl-[acyl-carrier-protein] reductase MabA n=1 Tax=Nocardia donostiensis TaxID=1538463 RepID=A0A1W0AV38_9NOCA|nr:SDR family NAD(P)-dependent oxidoreductase [Nocardia donostiensis]ONM49102.1 short-chain dehydrogenase [Nocardia donostiensis]OQS14120.1 short-chain dehydrogenase [Nocardia donostiensis]OQS19719.1 short-chain dehydrogenase [Nocardia donostiensis]
MRRYDGRRVVVTGAGSGIGQGIALRLLDEGAQLVAADIDETALATTAEKAGAAAERLHPVGVNIADPESVRHAAATALEKLGGLDVLVNAAGILRPGRTHEMPLEVWNQVITVNLTGTFLVTQALLPALVESGRGVVVNLSSTSAFSASPYLAAYAASKGGVNAFTHAIALEYAKQGLRAVNIVPAGITSGITTKSIADLPEGADGSLFARMVGWLDGGALGSPEDIAGAVAMVASDEGRYITGTEIRIDGGTLM